MEKPIVLVIMDGVGKGDGAAVMLWLLQRLPLWTTCWLPAPILI